MISEVDSSSVMTEQSGGTANDLAEKSRTTYLTLIMSVNLQAHVLTPTPLPRHRQIESPE